MCRVVQDPSSNPNSHDAPGDELRKWLSQNLTPDKASCSGLAHLISVDERPGWGTGQTWPCPGEPETDGHMALEGVFYA